MPVPSIASKARSLDRHHRPDPAFADRRQKLLEPGAADARARTTEIVIDDTDVGPAKLSGSLDQPILASMALVPPPAAISANRLMYSPCAQLSGSIEPVASPAVSPGGRVTAQPDGVSLSAGSVALGLKICSEMKPWGVEKAFSAAKRSSLKPSASCPQTVAPRKRVGAGLKADQDVLLAAQLARAHPVRQRRHRGFPAVHVIQDHEALRAGALDQQMPFDARPGAPEA